MTSAPSGPPPGVVFARSPDPDTAYIGTPGISILPAGSPRLSADHLNLSIR